MCAILLSVDVLVAIIKSVTNELAKLNVCNVHVQVLWQSAVSFRLSNNESPMRNKGSPCLLWPDCLDPLIKLFKATTSLLDALNKQYCYNI